MNIALVESAEKIGTTVKARADAAVILRRMGYEQVVLFHNGRAKPVILLEIIAGCLRAISKADKGDRIVFQYPYYSKFVHRIILLLLSLGRMAKGYKVCMLIHDVMAMRNKNWGTNEGIKSLRSEVKAWQWVDRVICHSENMRAAFQKVNAFDRYSVLGPFDYLYDGPVSERKYSPQPIVTFAGYLGKEKCGFLYRLAETQNIRMDLFGPNYTGVQTEFVHHRGNFPPEELISHLDGQFGLVWDGDSIDSCEGICGEYLKYNSPFKFSLYLAAGLPVIVWKKSALAEYVENNHIGIAIQNLHELPSKLNNLGEQEYNEMIASIMRVRADIVKGRQLKKAME